MAARNNQSSNIQVDQSNVTFRLTKISHSRIPESGELRCQDAAQPGLLGKFKSIPGRVSGKSGTYDEGTVTIDMDKYMIYMDNGTTVKPQEFNIFETKIWRTEHKGTALTVGDLRKTVVITTGNTGETCYRLYFKKIDDAKRFIQLLPQTTTKIYTQIPRYNVSVNLYHVRHGLSCANTQRHGLDIIRYRDPHLTQYGINKSIERGAEVINTLGDTKIDFIGSSILLRAIETAFLMFLPLKKKIHVLPYLREESGGGKLERTNTPYPLEQQKQRLFDKLGSMLGDLQENVDFDTFMPYYTGRDRDSSDYATFLENTLPAIIQYVLARNNRNNRNNNTLNIFIVGHSHFFKKHADCKEGDNTLKNNEVYLKRFTYNRENYVSSYEETSECIPFYQTGIDNRLTNSRNASEDTRICTHEESYLDNNAPKNNAPNNNAPNINELQKFESQIRLNMKTQSNPRKYILKKIMEYHPNKIQSSLTGNKNEQNKIIENATKKTQILTKIKHELDNSNQGGAAATGGRKTKKPMKSLNDLTVTQLRQLAKKHNLSIRKRDKSGYNTKAQLIAKLKRVK